jgi:hypothetical protein
VDLSDWIIAAGALILIVLAFPVLVALYAIARRAWRR